MEAASESPKATKSTKAEESDSEEDVLSDEEDDMDDFIVPDNSEEDEPGIRYVDVSLRELLQRSESEDDHQVCTTRPDVPSLGIPVLICRMPDEIFCLPTDMQLFEERDERTFKSFVTLAEMPRSDWGRSEFYKRFYTSVVVSAMSMGRASRSLENLSMHRLITRNCVKFETELDEGITGRCGACGINHRKLTYRFAILDEGGDKKSGMSAGCHCGEKIRCLIELYRILNCLPYLPLARSCVINALTVFNRWQSRLLSAISDSRWRPQEDEEDGSEIL